MMFIIIWKRALTASSGHTRIYGAPLLKYLDKSHYEVNLTREELRRITLWLDCNSNELGAYQDEAAQRRGVIVWPVFDLDFANILGVESR